MVVPLWPMIPVLSRMSPPTIPQMLRLPFGTRESVRTMALNLPTRTLWRPLLVTWLSVVTGLFRELAYTKMSPLLRTLPVRPRLMMAFLGTRRQLRLVVTDTPCITEWLMNMIPWLHPRVVLIIRRIWRMREEKSVMTTPWAVRVNVRLRVGLTEALGPMKLGILVPAELTTSRLMFPLLTPLNLMRLATWRLSGSRLSPTLFALTRELVGAPMQMVKVLGTERAMPMNLRLKGFIPSPLWLVILIPAGPRRRLPYPVLMKVRASPELTSGTLGCSPSRQGMLLTRLLRLRASIRVLIPLRWPPTQSKLGRTRLMFGRLLLGKSML